MGSDKRNFHPRGGLFNPRVHHNCQAQLSRVYPYSCACVAATTPAATKRPLRTGFAMSSLRIASCDPPVAIAIRPAIPRVACAQTAMTAPLSANVTTDLSPSPGAPVGLRGLTVTVFGNSRRCEKCSPYLVHMAAL